MDSGCFQLSGGGAESPKYGAVVHIPALAVLAADEIVGFGVVGDLEVGGVPLEAGARSESYAAQQDHLRQWAGVVEIRERLALPLAGVDPFLVVLAARAGQCRRRR